MIAGALALSQAAFAAEAPVKQDTTPKPAGMTIAECTTVLAGLEALDGYQTVINEGKPNVQVVARSYVFGNGTMRADIAHDISALRDVRHTAQEAQQAIFRELAKGAPEILQTVADQAGNLYQLLTSHTFSGAGSATLTFVAVNIGQTLTSANTITTITTPLLVSATYSTRSRLTVR